MGNIHTHDASSTAPSAELESRILCVPEGETARLLSVSRALLRKWRRTGDGPRWLKIGRCVRYPLAALKEFVRE